MNLTSHPHPVGKVKLYLSFPIFLFDVDPLIKIITKVEVSRQADPMSKEFHRMSANKIENRG